MASEKVVYFSSSFPFASSTLIKGNEVPGKWAKENENNAKKEDTTWRRERERELKAHIYGANSLDGHISYLLARGFCEKDQDIAYRQVANSFRISYHIVSCHCTNKQSRKMAACTIDRTYPVKSEICNTLCTIHTYYTVIINVHAFFSACVRGIQ